MEENTVNEKQNEAVTTGNEAPKKKVRISRVFLSLFPFGVCLMVQTLAQIPFYILAVVDTIKEGYSVDDIDAFLTAFLNIFNDRYLLSMYIVYAVLGITVFGIWYYKGFVKKRPKVKIGDVFGVKSLIALLLSAVSLFFVVNAWGVIVGWVMPRVIEEYNEMIEMSGLVNNSYLLVIYSIFSAPILEELCFRGVIFSILEDSGIRPWFIILISGALFAVMHITIPFQMVYALFIGLFLGYLRYKYRSIMITILTHILFNVFGTFVSDAINESGMGEGAMVIFGGVALCVIAFVFVLVNGDKKAYKPDTK